MTRLELLRRCNASQALRLIELERCRRDKFHWIRNWVWTYDPRVIPDGRNPWMPLALFKRQIEMLDFIDARVAAREDGLIEKSRDIGFTWCAGSWAVHRWLFDPGFKTTFGSRKEMFVDRRGDPDSIFEKFRMILARLPRWQWPRDFGQEHDNHMRLINPETGSTIVGEAGEEIGRGGRSSVVILDEFAFVPQAESVDASTSGNTETRIFGSSVAGMGNLFARKRHGGQLRPDQIFRFHYSDDPRKTVEWAKKKRASMEDHKWGSEYDIDYSASVEGICIPARYVEASLALSAMVKEGTLKAEPTRRGTAGLDVGAGGKAKSVFVARFGPVVTTPVPRGDPDTTGTAHWALDLAKGLVLKRSDAYECRVTVLNYDSVGVGHDVQYALKTTPKGGIAVNPTNTGLPPTDMKWPDGETSVEKFLNLKAEGWWKVRDRLKRSYELWQHLTKATDMDGKPLGHAHAISDCLLLPLLTTGIDAQILASQLSLPKWFRSSTGKIQIESKKEMAVRELPSPDHADALILTECTGSALSSWERLAAGG